MGTVCDVGQPLVLLRISLGAYLISIVWLKLIKPGVSLLASTGKCFFHVHDHARSPHRSCVEIFSGCRKNHPPTAEEGRALPRHGEKKAGVLI